MSLFDDKQAGIIVAVNSTSRYLDDILNSYNVYFDNMVTQIYPPEPQRNKAYTSDTRPRFQTCICHFLMILFLPKFMIKVTILILNCQLPFKTVMSLALHPMESISLNSFVC